MSVISPFDREELCQRVQVSSPFPFFYIDGFLEERFAHEVAAAFPGYEEAVEIGHRFHAVNEKKKVQVSDAALFPPALARLHVALVEPAFCEALGEIFGIPHLLPDPLLEGGGLHLTSGGGHLDVHVDFNYIAERKLHRRLNILVYLNQDWQEGWGGELEPVGPGGEALRAAFCAGV